MPDLTPDRHAPDELPLDAATEPATPSGLPDFEFYADRALVIVHCAGRCDAGAWCALLDAVLDDPRWRPGMSLLVDRRRTVAAPTRADVEAMVGFFRRRATDMRGARCAVVTGTPAACGMARMLETVAERDAVVVARAFDDDGGAMEWLLAVR